MRIPLALLLCLLPVFSAAADLTCRAEVDRRQAALGEHVVLTVHAEARGAQPPRHEPPVVAEVEVVAGGSSQSFSLIGGATSIAVSTTYYLRFSRAGEFRIPPVEFQLGSQRCATEPLAIRVTASPSQPPHPVSGPGSPGGAPPPAAAGGLEAGQPGDPAFVSLRVDRDEVWLGQQLILTFRYHRLRNVWGQPSYTPPRTEGFWRIDLPPERNFRQSLAGQMYEVTEIRYALFPTRVGDLHIDPARLVLAGDPFDRFFGRRAGGPRQLTTAPLTIKVKEWPSPRPPDFSGIAASDLAFSASVDRQTVPRGEPATLTLRIQADAFLKGFRGLKLTEPEGLRFFDAAETVHEDASGPRYLASYVQETAVVPLREGDLPLPALQLVYFDTKAGRYRTVAASQLALHVTRSDLPVVGDDPSGFRRAEIARLGRDLAFIHAPSGRLRRHASALVQQPVWWLALLAPWCLLGGYRGWLAQRQRAARDPAGLRRRQAWRQARRSLRTLQRRGGEPVELARIIHRYVADHLQRQPAAVTTAEIRRWCAELQSEASGAWLTDLLAACDRARYGGQGTVDVSARAGEVCARLESLEAAARSRLATRDPRRGAPPLATFALAALMTAAAGEAGGDAVLAAPTAPGPDPARLVAEGNQAYTAGDLETARQNYREALARGADDAVVHYNLGNVLARQGELGRAIASYLRAQRLAPRDHDVRANLAWVRANTRDLELAGHRLPPVIAQLDAAVHLLSLDEWAIVLALCSWLTAVLVAWTWRRGWLSAGLRRWRLLLATFTTLAAVAVATRGYAEIHRDVAVVVAAEVAVRSGPAESFPVVFRVHDGLTLEVRAQRDGWARIALGGDWAGWVPGGVLEHVRQR